MYLYSPDIFPWIIHIRAFISATDLHIYIMHEESMVSFCFGGHRIEKREKKKQLQLRFSWCSFPSVTSLPKQPFIVWIFTLHICSLTKLMHSTCICNTLGNTLLCWAEFKWCRNGSCRLGWGWSAVLPAGWCWWASCLCSSGKAESKVVIWRMGFHFPCLVLGIAFYMSEPIMWKGSL